MAVTQIETDSWQGRLLARACSAIGQPPPRQADPWRRAAILLAAAVFLACAFVICVVLNIGTMPLGVFVEPIWQADARFRRLTFPGGIPIIAVALPIVLAFAAWRNWAAHGIALTLGPFVFTAVLAFALLGVVVLFNRMRRRLPRPLLGDGEPETAP